MSYLHEWRPDLRLKTSLTLAVWLAVFHLALLAILPFWEAALLLRLLVVACVLVSWAHCHRKYVLLRGKRSVRRVQWCNDGWMLETNGGLIGPLLLSKNSRVAKDFVLLHFRHPVAWYKPGLFVPVLRDGLASNNYRTLQIFLRWQKSKVLNPSLYPQGESETPEV